jgi:NitT/TauT family transport system permease protein
MIIHQKSIYLVEKITSSIYHIEQGIFSIFHKWSDNRNNNLSLSKLNTHTKTAIAFLGLLSLALFIAAENTAIISKLFFGVSPMFASLFGHPQTAKVISLIPTALLLSFLRLSAAYLITLAWTIPVAIRIARSQKFSGIMSLIQTFASIPATAFFPFMAALVSYIPGGLEFPSILLILTGMQWYMLFNLIGGVRSISGDIEEVAKAFHCTKSLYLKRVFFPSIYPSFITGSITAWGGGWNALIVSEYLIYGNKTYAVLGIGSLLDYAAYGLGNAALILIIVGVMVATIIAINNLVWRRLYKKVLKDYSLNI